MATTFHTAIFTREGTLGLTIAECETSAAAVVASVKPGGAAQSRRVRPGDVSAPEHAPYFADVLPYFAGGAARL